MSKGLNPDNTIDNRYKIIKELGRGGMGIVYLVEDTLKDNMLFALKTIRHDIIDVHKSTGIATFKNEYEIMTRLKHPSLTRVYEFGEDRENYYIVMEYLTGTLLSDLKISGEKECIDLLVQILRALEYIHSRNIIYRDIKPGNIMIIKKAIKLMDFGISGLIHTQDRKIKGTLSYISPEVLTGNASFSADIFSLGIVFYELISGIRFYENGRGIISAIVNLLGSPSEYALFQKERINNIKNMFIGNIIKKMTAYSIDERYRTCSQIIGDINSSLGLKYDYETSITKFSYVLGNAFADRDVEIDSLKAKVKDRKTLKMLVYCGPSGVGKTRLFLEFKKYCRLNNIPFFDAKCMEGETQDYKSISELLSQLITFSTESLLKNYGKYLRLILPCDNRLVNFRTPDIFDNPKVFQDIIVQNITDYIIEFAKEQKDTAIIYFDDLQWIDSGSELILKNLLYRIDIMGKENRRLLFYANINVTKLDMGSSIMDIMSIGGVEKYDLQSLDLKGINEYIDNVFGAAFIDESLKNSVMDIKERVGGHPLFLEELIRSLIDKDIIIKDVNCWKLLNSVHEAEIPGNLIDIAQKRLSALFEDPDKRRILRILSMLRINLSISAIKAIICKIAAADTAKVLLELESLEILQCLNIDNVLYYCYSSSLIKDIVRRGINNRTEISIFLAETLESISDPESEEYLEEIAYHYKEGKDIEKAVYYYEKSGDRAKSHYFNVKALNHYKTALYLMENYHTADLKVQTKIKLKIASILYLQGEWDKSAEILRECIKVSKKINDKGALSESKTRYGLLKLNRGELNEALSLFEESASLSEEIGDNQGLLEALQKIGNTFSCFSRYQEALLYYERCEKIIHQTGNTREAGKIAESIGNIYYSLNQYEKALKYFHLSRDIADQCGDKLEAGQATGDIGNVYLALGEYHKALECYQKNRKITEEIGDKQGRGKAIGNEGVVYYCLGQYQKALESNKIAKNISEEIGYKQGIIRALGNMGNIYKDLRQYLKALECYKASRQISEEIGDRWGIGASTGNMGLIYDSLEQYEEALECFETARTISQEIGFKHGYGVSTGSMGSIYFYLGKFQKALECFRIKKDIAKELGDKRGYGIAEVNSGLVYQATGKYKEAMECFEIYRSLSEEMDHKPGIKSALSYLSDLYIDMGDFRKASEYNEKAIQLDKEIEGSSKEYPELLIKKAFILRRLDKIKEAGLIIAEAIELARQIDHPVLLARAKIQNFIIDFACDKASSVQSLLEMLPSGINKEHEASLYYELYLIENDPEYSRKAIDMYESIYKEMPRYIYKEKIENLRKSKNLNPSMRARQGFRPIGS